MKIDELPEDTQAKLRLAGSVFGLNVEDERSLMAVMHLVMAANEEQSCDRDDIDREAGDWDSDDFADDNNPAYKLNREIYMDTKDACQAVTRTLDRAYAVKGRGDSVTAMETRLDASLHESLDASENGNRPLLFGEHVQPQLKQDVHRLRSSFRRTRINELQLRTFIDAMRADVHNQMAGRPSSTSDEGVGARMQLQLTHGVAAMSQAQLEAAHGAFIRCTAVRGAAQAAGWSPGDADWGTLETAVRSELDKPRALPTERDVLPDGAVGLARYDPLRTRDEVTKRRKSDPAYHPADNLRGVARAVADGRVREYSDLLEYELLPRHLTVDPDGEVVVAFGCAGHKNRGSSAAWWRMREETVSGAPKAHRVRDRLCAAGVHAAAYHAAEDTLWLASGFYAWGFTPGASQQGYALSLPAHSKSLGVSGRTLLSVSKGANQRDVLCAWSLEGLGRVERLAQRTPEAEAGRGWDDPCM
jgi:hypothetical protein